MGPSPKASLPRRRGVRAGQVYIGIPPGNTVEGRLLQTSPRASHAYVQSKAPTRKYRESSNCPFFKGSEGTLWKGVTAISLPDPVLPEAGCWQKVRHWTGAGHQRPKAHHQGDSAFDVIIQTYRWEIHDLPDSLPMLLPGHEEMACVCGIPPQFQK